MNAGRVRMAWRGCATPRRSWRSSFPGTPGHVPACEKMYNGGISRVARGCPAFPDFTSGDSMDTFIQMLRNISPEVYESLKTAVELGKWADGRKLTQEQKELCLQAIIAWEMDNLPEEERTGYIAQSCKTASKAPANLVESRSSAAKALCTDGAGQRRGQYPQDARYPGRARPVRFTPGRRAVAPE